MAGWGPGGGPPIRAVLFDLDGTLNGIDMDQFLPRYFEALAASTADLVEPGRLTREVWKATQALFQDKDPGVSNLEKFRRAFFADDEALRARLWPRFDRFYAEGFDALRIHAPEAPFAREVVQAVRSMGMRIAIATNPVFPEAAIRRRMQWAGLEESWFDLITTMENMHYCKPDPAYFQEAARHLGVDVQQCLMVGNDKEDDMAAALAGMQTYWATDRPIDRGRLAVRPDGQGPLVELVGWLQRRLAAERATW